MKGYQNLSLGLKKEFLDKRLTVQLTGNDILNTGIDFYYDSNFGGMIVNGVRSFDNLRFGFSATYNFGNQQAKAARRKQSAIYEELKRIAD